MRADDSDILLALYRSAQDSPAWAGFLRALAARTGATAAYLVAQREGESPQIFGQGTPPLASESLARMRYMRSYSGDDMVAKQPFRALRTRAEGGGDAWVIVARRGEDFASATSAVLSSIAPHIALAAAQFWRQEQALAGQSAAQNMAGRLGIAWVLLDANGAAILASDPAPAGILMGDKLRLAPHTQRQLTQQISSYAESQTTKPLAVLLGPRQALLVPFSGHGAAAMLYVLNTKPAQNQAQNQAWPVLADIFGLTPNEARFAAELAGGKSIAQAGEALGFTVETARHYSKQLYAKLGAAGQVEVIRRIENSVYRLL
jgi:DNA-binding CsgD family transcriptional regulator